MKIIKTDKLKKKPENELGFGQIFTDYMLIKEYKNGAWGETEIKPYAPISLDPSSACLHYGQEVFEGLKAYTNDKGEVLLFRPEENFKRLNISNERMGIPKIDEKEALNDLKELINLEKEWIPKCKGASLYIRPFIIATEVGLGVHPATNYLYIVILSPSGSYYKNGLAPVSIYVEDKYVRAVKGGTGFAKTGGNYSASLIAQKEAQEKGYDQVLWLDGANRKYIEEVGAMNIAFVLKNKIITPNLSGSILDGITRKSIITLAKSFGLEVEERKISIDELFELHEKGELLEAFGTGTAAVISPVGKIAYKGKEIILNQGNIGEISQKLYDTLTGIQYGEIEDKFNFTIKI